MTILTWCEECGEDMHINGGRMCKFCDNEYCYSCLEEHEDNCDKNPYNIEYEKRKMGGCNENKKLNA